MTDNVDQSDKAAHKTQFAKQFIQVIPHAVELGMELIEIGDGKAEIDMPYDTRFVGDPETGVLHGGAVSALMDTCCGAAAMSHPQATTGTATIDLRIDYMRPATPGQTIRANAICYHMTRSVAFVRATAVDDDDTRPVATATGTFTVEGK
ncbi:MAG: PaaI family thioesterase [Rhodobacterales bacterium]|nr:PaaI family thioesterase [Rhodobacterales bacterium]